MDKRRMPLITMILLLLLACSSVQARKVFIYGHGGGPLRGWFSLKLVEVHGQPEQEYGARNRFDRHATEGLGLAERMMRHREHARLWGSLRDFPGLSSRDKSFTRFPLEERPVSSSLDGVSESFICKTCLNITTQAQQVLSDPDTLNHIIEYVNSSLCDVLMGGLQEECSGLASTYIPEALQMLQAYMTPDKLCVDTKICPSISMLLLEDDRTCAMCEKFAAEALGYLNDTKTETEAVAALHSACSKLGRFSARCDLLVDMYAPTLFAEVDTLTPQQLCERIKLCSVSVERKSYCAACENVILEMKAKLRNPVMREKLIEELLNVCTKVPQYVEKCQEIVTQYGPFIFANMDSLLDADTMCTKIHACEAVPSPNITPAVIKGELAETTGPFIRLRSESRDRSAV